MNYFKFHTAAVFLTAVLFSCGGRQEHETTHHEGHEISEASKDTVHIMDGQSVFFENLTDGQEVKAPVNVKFGVQGMTVMSIDSGVIANSGHHHLLIDTFGFIPAGEVVPAVDGKIIHFGKGQVEVMGLKLPAGKHKLCLQFADGLHRSYGVRMSKTIWITVLE